MPDLIQRLAQTSAALEAALAENARLKASTEDMQLKEAFAENTKLRVECVRLRGECAAYRADYNTELEGGAELRKCMGAREDEPIWTAAERIVAENATLRDAAHTVIASAVPAPGYDERVILVSRWALGRLRDVTGEE